MIKYDSVGNWIENRPIEQSEDESHSVWCSVKLDNMGNWIEKKSYDEQGNCEEVEKMEYVYDPNKNWVKMVTFKDEIPKFIKERIIEYYY